MKRTKYNVSTNKETRLFDGILFASNLEMRYYRDYVLPKMNDGLIKKCELQVKYPLQDSFKHKDHTGKVITVRAIDYVADFVITWENGTRQIIDTKGKPDNTALLKRKLFWLKYPDEEYIWVSYSKANGGWIIYDDLQKIRRENKKAKMTALKKEK